jgi:hypothetical protein
MPKLTESEKSGTKPRRKPVAAKPGAVDRAVAVAGGPVPVNTGPILSESSEAMYGELVMVGGVACDWLTLTTFDLGEYLQMQAYTVAPDSLRRLPIKETSRMQYRGWRGDGWFVGEGRQDGLPHYMMQASGARAHDALRYALMFHDREGKVKCTRIDLQCTSSSTFAGDLPAVAEVLRGLPAGAFGGRGPRPQVTYFSSEESKDTLYIGSRKSPRFWRFYNKPVDGELRLRAELEAKGWLGQQLWENLCDVGAFHVASLFAHELGALPEVLRNVSRETWSAHGDAERTPKPKVDRTAVKATQKWLMECVLPAFERIMQTEEGREVRQQYMLAMGFDELGNL